MREHLIRVGLRHSDEIRGEVEAGTADLYRDAEGEIWWVWNRPDGSSCTGSAEDVDDAEKACSEAVFAWYEATS